MKSDCSSDHANAHWYNELIHNRNYLLPKAAVIAGIWKTVVEGTTCRTSVKNVVVG